MLESTAKEKFFTDGWSDSDDQRVDEKPCGVSTESKAYAATCIFLSMLAAQLGWGRSEFNSVRNAFGIAISRPMPNP